MDIWITQQLQHLMGVMTLAPDQSPAGWLMLVFAVATLSATLLPMGSEALVLAVVQPNPQLFWPVVCVATVGNTLGGAISWWMGFGAQRVADRLGASRSELKALEWLRRLGPKACLLSWLPAVGDPLCAVAGWLKLPFWQCVAYMAIGKFLRYVIGTAALLGLFRMW